MRYKSDKDIIRELNEEDDYPISSFAFNWIITIVVLLLLVGMAVCGYCYLELG